jgi:hypothetical protein
VGIINIDGLEWTHDSGEVTVQLFDDTSKTATGVVEQFPAPAHCGSVPTRSRMFLLFCDIASCFVIIPELQENAEIIRVSEGQSEYFEYAHSIENEGRKEQWTSLFTASERSYHFIFIPTHHF